MKLFIIRILSGLGWLISWLFPYKFRSLLITLKSYIYTGWIKRVFKHFEGRVMAPIKVIGGKNISVGRNTLICERVQFETICRGVNGEVYSPEIIIGEDVIIQRDVQITSSNKVIIGDHVDIAARTLITDTVHGDFSPFAYTFNNGSDIPDVFLKNARTRDYVSKGPVIIEDNVHIGMNCIIMPGVTIGKGSVIPAGTTITKSLPPYSLVTIEPSKMMSFS